MIDDDLHKEEYSEVMGMYVPGYSPLKVVDSKMCLLSSDDDETYE